MFADFIEKNATAGIMESYNVLGKCMSCDSNFVEHYYEDDTVITNHII